MSNNEAELRNFGESRREGAIGVIGSIDCKSPFGFADG